MLRRSLEVKSNIDVVAINDLTSPKILAWSPKHDSNYGPFPWSVDFTEDSLIVDGKSISVYAKKEAKNIPWKAKGARNHCRMYWLYSPRNRRRILMLVRRRC
ncbi:glyceraldehyde 3-phosphate dehydrogenase NAD-binding domain-containing protein [Escherichia coli]